MGRVHLAELLPLELACPLGGQLAMLLLLPQPLYSRASTLMTLQRIH